MGVVSPPVDLGARIAPWETLTLRDACAVATAGTNDGSAFRIGFAYGRTALYEMIAICCSINRAQARGSSWFAWRPSNVRVVSPPVDLGARINRYRCCLPALAGFSI
ncbi:conserved hypothetical protein [Xanthomonas citri pv. fuscans]|nr:conserved hypothetical protein [Xanthomonas citri pv. fuscans]